MNIKMICSDLDGTILSYNQTKITDRLIEQIQELHKRNIIFVPTSGRQICSMLKLFEPVQDCCYFIGSNGAAVFDGTGALLDKTVMPRDVAIEIAYDMWNRADQRSEVCLSGTNMSYLMLRDLGMLERILFIKNDYVILNSPEEIKEDIVKVSTFLTDGVDAFKDRFLDKWKAYNAAVAGSYWLDTMLANKGTGIDMLCTHLNISPNEVIAIGDNYNDISMLDAVGHPYIMSSSAEELLVRYPNHVDCVEDFLDEILKNECK